MDNRDDVILGVVRNVAHDKHPEIESVAREQTLVEDLGLASLDLAVIVAKLERKLGVDPFAERVPITRIRTVGDLCAAYASCFGEAAPEVDEAPSAPRTAGTLEAQRELRKKAKE